MLTPDKKEDRAKRRRLKKQIRRDAEMRMAKISSTPTMREIYAPKVIFGAIFILAVIGGLLIHKVSRKVRNDDSRPIPHLTAIRSLDTLATALGRYKMHVGHFPTTEQGLKALNMDFGEKGWNGPYLVQLMEDPWFSNYNYEMGTNALPLLFSSGPDRIPNTNDDLYPGEEYFDPGTTWTNNWKSRFERLPDIVLQDSTDK